MKKIQLTILLCSFCALFGLLSILGADYLSQVAVAHHSSDDALRECLSNFQNVISTVFLLTPFLVVGFGTAILEMKNRIAAWCFSISSLLLLAALYCYGYFGSQHALLEKAWTAASLSIGLLPFFSVPVIAAYFGIVFAISIHLNQKRNLRQ
jgi:hypothetical protein